MYLLKLFKKGFDFFVFSSLFIACCAVLMAYQVHLLFDVYIPVSLYGFVFSGSVCSYNFHWYLTPPNVGGPSEKIIWNISNKKIHFGLFILGIILSGIFTILLIEHWLWLLFTAFVTFLYSAPKIPHPAAKKLQKIAVGKTVFLAFAWTHVTALLPLLMKSPILTNEQILFVLNRFYLIYAICILFDYRDREEDLKAGIKNLATSLNERGIDIIFWGSLVAFYITVFLLRPYQDITNLICIALPGAILGFLYNPAKRDHSDYLYYFVLDGLMMLSAPLLVLAKFAR
ncbi:MAG TPA: hypothetical protein VHK91_01475 [Flavisolibacter sp.]|nr:hypothetical protein [Flavisolibacter sp.]